MQNFNNSMFCIGINNAYIESSFQIFSTKYDTDTFWWKPGHENWTISQACEGIILQIFLFVFSYSFQLHLKTTARDHKLNLLITLKTYQTATIFKLSQRNAIFNIEGETSGTIYDETHKEHIINTNSMVEVTKVKNR